MAYLLETFKDLSLGVSGEVLPFGSLTSLVKGILAAECRVLSLGDGWERCSLRLVLLVFFRFVFFFVFTPPKTNMAPENGPLEKEIPIGNHNF